MNVSFLKYKAFVLFVVLTGLQPDALAAVSQCNPVKGRLTSIEGSVEIGYGGKAWQPGELDSALCEEDSVRVGPNSRAAISLVGDVMLRLDQNTTVRLVDLTEKPEERSIIELITGALQSLSRSPRKLAVNTPYINGMIEGTEFLTRVDQGRADITVFEGKVIAQNDLGSMPLTPGQSAEAQLGQPPQARIVVQPRGAVQWALYYPPVIDFGPEAFATHEAIKGSLLAYQNADFKNAFALIASEPFANLDANALAYRASLFLAVGRVDNASADIDRLLQSNPNDANALALQAIIKVVQDQKSQAIEISSRAIQFSPESSSALIAHSYAQQAAFDLEGARQSIEKVVAKDSENALAWARLAELHASFGELDNSLLAAKKAVQIRPNLSRTQTVLGFSQLMQVDVDQAKESFNKAIVLTSSDPLPRLGLGLAKIREGDLVDGRREIEIAAGLDPNNAIVRSYLGKAYFEEKRTALTDREYETAKELDPNDPTPYFYDAIQKQTTNRPVEALEAMQKAIELNDNRAVYRSKLLLDADLAARSASLGRIYTDLGFQELALREGWKSSNANPSSFSAHRFLADSYSVVPRSEIARVSELLQSQMLQPLSMTPIQPHLAESNLLLIASGGAGGMSFNEFNPIFNRDGLSFQTNGYAGSNDTYAGEQVVSGIYDKAAFSIGYSQFNSNGWRPNANQDDAIANAFLQYEISPQTSIQTEYRYRNRKTGDLNLRFLQDNLTRDLNQLEERNSVRLGLRHAFAPNSTLLASYVFQHRNSGQEIQPNDGGFVSSINDQFPDQNSNSGEIQHLYNSEYFNLTSGVGYFDVNADRMLSVEFNPLFVGGSIQSAVPENTQHWNFYLYSYLNIIKNVTFNLGASGDIYNTTSSTTDSKSQFNPKFGVTWNVLPGTTFRAAAFRVLKRTLINDQTLEPTQIAGFNQFYDDFNSTDSWRFGGAIDQKFSSTLFGGIEFSKRELNMPFQYINELNELDVNRDNGEEYLGRSYLFWTPQPWLALNAEYQHENFKNSPELAFDYMDLDTDRYSFGLKVFDQSGFSASFQASNYNQTGDFVPFGGNACCTIPGSSNFWILDTSVSYRLPKRYGIIKVGANNLLNEQFNYFDTNRGVNNRNPLIIPDRVIFGSITLAFP